MWILFSLLSLVAFAAADLLGKKKIDLGRETASLELMVSYEAVAVLFSLLIWGLELGESGQSPWRLVLNDPLITAAVLCSLIYWLLFLVSMRYAGLSVEEAVSGAYGVYYFTGLLAVNLITGKLSAVHDMLHLIRLIPIILVIAFTFLLPNIEVIAQKCAGELFTKAKTDRRRLFIGLIILLAAVAFDSADTLISTVVFEESDIGAVDYTMASAMLNVLPMMILSVYLKVKNGKWYHPFADGGKYVIGYAVFMLLSIVLYMLSASLDAVRTGIIFIVYPIVPIVGAKIFLKEKYTWKQNLCIWVITIASIVFCASDYVL